MRLYERKWCSKDGTAFEIPKSTQTAYFAIDVPREFLIHRIAVGCETDSVGTVSFTATLFNRNVPEDTSDMGTNEKAAYRAISQVAQVTGTTIAPGISNSTYITADKTSFTSGGARLYLEISLASALEKNSKWAVAIVGQVGGALQ